jgi:hypothetical protein
MLWLMVTSKRSQGANIGHVQKASERISVPDNEISLTDIPRARKKTDAPWTFLVEPVDSVSRTLSGTAPDKMIAHFEMDITPSRTTAISTAGWAPLAEGQTSSVIAARAELCWVSSRLPAELQRNNSIFKVRVSSIFSSGWR